MKKYLPVPGTVYLRVLTSLKLFHQVQTVVAWIYLWYDDEDY